MADRFRDQIHLIRLAGVFVAGGLVFLLMRALLVPSDFGVLGHYRASALTDNREVPMAYAGRQACADCHDDMSAELAGGGHAGVGCEACHGAWARHAEDPAAVVPELPGARMCVICHARSAARPDWFPQVQPEEHSGGEECTECHQAHRPGFE